MTNENNSNKNVHGTVSDGRNNKLSNLLVKAFDRDMRSEGLLGECLTDAKGAYTISYTEEQYNYVEKRTADLAVKVYSGGGKILLYETDLDGVVFNASDDETIDVVISGEIKSEENEFDRIERELSGLIGKVEIPQLQENDEHRDITFLSKETGFSAEKLEHFVVAARINSEFEIDAAFFYGLFRKNTLLRSDVGDKLRVRFSIDINTDLKPLVYEAALADAEIIHRDLKAAIEEMIIPARVGEAVKKYITFLREYAKDAEEYYANDHQKKVFDIATRFVLEDKIGEMGRIFQENKNDLQGFFKKITNDSFFKTESDASSVKTSAALMQLLGFDDSIISQVKKTQKIKKSEDVKKLAALNKADWKRVLTQSAGKINIAGKKLDKKLIDFHASALVRRMEKEFPAVAFAAQLEREKKPVLENHDAIKGFLKKHADFDLKNSNIDLFLKEKKLAGKKNEAMRAEMKTVQRIFKLVPHYGKTNSLLQKNIHSAQSIAAVGESRFVKEIAPEAGISQAEAKEIFKKAEMTNTAAMLVVGELQDTIRAMDVSALQVNSLSNKITAVKADFPNLKTLFQLTDVCACEHCRSVYSPAAYLVEILQFLDKRSVVDLTVAAPTPPATRPSVRIAKDVLFDRRPDLGYIDLGCENANTPIPYIDLVCELLEEAVAPDAGIQHTGVLSDGPDPLRGKISSGLYHALTTALNPIPVTPKALIFETETTSGSSAALPHYLRDKNVVCVIINTGGNSYVVKQLRQTLHSAEELAAAPAYVNHNAYVELLNKEYAFKLPFDLNHIEAKAYFSRFDIERSVLMSDFQVALTPSDKAIAAEHLGLTRAQRRLIVNPKPNDQKKYWNTTTTNASDEMKIVDTFLTKSGLTYKELELLLLLKFIDPTGNLFIKHNYDDPTAPHPTISCDTTKKEIANLNDDALDRMHRFLRIQKITGWEFSTLDQIIVQSKLGNGTLDNACLIKASILLKISEITGIKLEELLGFFDEIPHEELSADAKKPLYHQIFLNKAKNGFIDEGLLPANVGINKPLSSYKTSISVCLQISEQDFDKLVPFFTSGDLTFANLSALYVASKLISKLKLKLDDLIILTELTKIDITDSPDKTLKFVEAAIASKQLPLKPADVKFMLRHEAANISDREIKDEKIEQILIKLQNAYKKASAANKSPYDDDLSADEQKEAVGNLLSKLSGVGEEDVKIFLGLIDGTWIFTWIDENDVEQNSVDVTTAIIFVKEKLDRFFKTAQIEAALIALAGSVEDTRKALVKAYLDSISAYLYIVEIRNSLQQTIVATFKSDVDLTNIVLNIARLRQLPPPLPPPVNPDLLGDLLLTNDFLTMTVSSTNFPEQYAAIRLLHKLFPLISSFKLENENVEWHLKNNTTRGWFALDSIPYQAAQSSVNYSIYIAFAEMLSIGKQLTPVPNPADSENPTTFYTLLDMLLDNNTLQAEWIDAFSLLTGYEKQDVYDIDAYLFPIANPSLWNISHYFDIETWKLFEKITTHLRNLGSTVAQVKKFIKPVLTPADVHSLRAALKARYDDETWLSTLKQIMNAIRPRKRDALVAYLLATKPGMRDANDLYNYFLIDVEMESCMPSSRIVQAHGTVQLFVQRCLMGLEPKAAADLDNDSKWTQWKWMRNYRVWEANRKIFLYPENWLDGEFRDGKSFLFQELEDELLQKELNENTAEEALIKYLEGLDNISFLEIAATWYQTETRTMHVFGRTKGDPPTYYYRQLIEEKIWTPWEIVNVDISGKHVIAYVRRNRLNLAWLVFKEEPDPNPKATVPAGDAGTVDADKPKRKLEMTLAISEFTGKEWLSKKISNDHILTPSGYTNAELPRGDYNLMYLEASQQIRVLRTSFTNDLPRSFTNYKEHHHLVGTFNILGCKGFPELVPQSQEIEIPDFLPDFRDAPLKTQRYTEQNLDYFQFSHHLVFRPDDLSVKNAFFPYQFLELLLKTPGTFNITYPHQLTPIDITSILFQYLLIFASGRNANYGSLQIPIGTLLPYFMEDGDHAYVIIPAFYGIVLNRTWHATTSVIRSASDVLQLIDDVNALVNKYTQMYNADPHKNVNALMEKLSADRDYRNIITEINIYWNLGYAERFKNMYHPLMCSLRTILYNEGIPALMTRKTQRMTGSFNFQTNYQPTNRVTIPLPVENIDFSYDGSYSSYNWEIFFHIPFLLATRLSKDQQFEEAMKWFHYIFNPTGALEGDVPQKYWVTNPFFETSTGDYVSQRIDTLLYKLADPATAKAELDKLTFAVGQWREHPFMPHVVARYRPVAYQKATVMKYLDNLIEWGDYLFRQDTTESIVQATQMYNLARELLGDRPRTIPPPITAPYENYNQIEAKIDSFGNALIDLENILPDLSVLPEGGAELPPPPITLSMLYFCIPQNDTMLKYWDIIEERLFNIHNCRNIKGIERSLALFAPPIDPGMLVRAAASGLDISSVIAGINAPAPFYRFNVLAQKATELTQEVRSLGSSLLQAWEKADAEAMALLRSELEIKVLKAVRDMKRLQISEAKEQIESLKKTKAVTEERHRYYSTIQKIIPNEQLNLDKLEKSHKLQEKAQGIQLAASLLALIPDIDLGASGFGGSPIAKFKFGGLNLAQSSKAASDVLSFLSMMASNQAAKASIQGGFDRRWDDWQLQARLAEKELAQIDTQIAAAEIRQEIAETDLKNHDLQTANALETDKFMRTKFTNKQLYTWMIGQISSVYFRAYKLAHDCSKKAERCYRFELGNDDTFIDFGYWDTMKKGLQSADRLFYDIKRMETSYLDKNKRENEITKHVSLATLDPLALIMLRATGTCNFEIPEAIYDMDHPGHYFRRIKTVAISILCVAGPYTSVSAKLSLVSNKYRKNATKAQGTIDPKVQYEEVIGNDDRFVYNVGAIQSIAASNSQNDSGMFELNFRDERYLPFESCGAIGTWRLELPDPVRQFDYDTISDVVLHIKYTTRDGGSTLKSLASNTLRAKLAEIQQRLGEPGLHVFLNMRHDMPNEWHLLKTSAVVNSANPTIDFSVVNLTIDKSRLPYFAQAMNPDIESVIFLARFKNAPINPIKIDTEEITLALNEWHLYQGSDSTVIEIDAPFDLSVSQADLANLDDLIMVVKYSF